MTRTRSRGSARQAAAARNAAKQRAFNLGLAISAATLAPGEWRSAKTLARYCGVSHQAIEQIEAIAVAKVRRALRLRYGIISTSL
jgi:hypothetical protein